VGTTRETNMPERRSENAGSTVSSRIELVRGYVAPTTSALVQFVTIIGSQEASPALNGPVEGTQIPLNVSEPTASAEAVFVSQGWASKVRVPGQQAGHLLDTLTFAFGVGAIVSVCTAILRSTGGSPGMRLALCTVCTVVIGGLTAVAIYRRI
jgi:hypothetical protein